jgi:ribulose-5-phosphate 4-epimerase/fuculose-1-phosphate aldolase
MAAAEELLGSADVEKLVGLDVIDIREDNPSRYVNLCDNNKFEYVWGRVEDYDTVYGATKGVDVVVHLAAIPDDAEANVLLPVNVTGLSNVLAACRERNRDKVGVRRLIVASSGKMWVGYGSVRKPIKIHDEPAPRCLYAATKAFAESAAESFAEDYEHGGCPTIVMRFAWCPRTIEDVEAMKMCSGEAGQGTDEFLSPRDAGTCVLAAATQMLPEDLRFAALFCQSIPPKGRTARFDTYPTKVLLGWKPVDTFPAGIESICQGAKPNKYLKKRRGYSVISRSSSYEKLKAGVSLTTVQGRVSHEEWGLRVQLAAAYRVFAMLGWTHIIHTHITVKVPSSDPSVEHFLINPYGMLWSDITASSLVKVQADGGIVDQGSTSMPINPAGFKIHSAIHTSVRGRHGGDILWTMHTHTTETVAVASLNDGLIRGLSQYAMDLGAISYHDFEHATSGTDVCKRLVQDLGPTNKVLLLRNHGNITVGGSVHEAFFLMYQLIEACKVQVQVIANVGTAGYAVVPDNIVEETYRIVQANYTGEPFGKLEWRAMKHKMEREQGLGYQQ